MPTVWDSIYQNFKNKGEVWATLDGKIDANLLRFLDATDFPERSVLDIGCGEGKYLALFESRHWQVAGVDSSPTAIEMAKTRIDGNEGVVLGDMFSFTPTRQFGLIISINAIHHGIKEDVMALLRRLPEMLLPGGWVFITVLDHDLELIKHGQQQMKEISPGTYVPTVGPETGQPHSFFTQEDIEQCFAGTEIVSIKKESTGRWVVIAQRSAHLAARGLR